MAGGTGASEGSGEGGDTDDSDASTGSPETSTASGSADSSDTGVPLPPDPPEPPVEQQWEHVVETPAPYDAFCDVAVLPDGTIAASGTSAEDINADQIGGSAWIYRLSSAGQTVDTIHLPQDHAPLSLSVDVEGRLFIVGTRGLYPDTAEHFFSLRDIDAGEQWMIAQDTNWGYQSCNGSPVGFADGEALADGMLVARYEDAGSKARIFHPFGEIVAEVALGGSIGGFHTIAATGADSFAGLGERASATGVDDDWALLRYDSSGALLWEQQGGGRPGELFAVGPDLWHFVWDSPEGDAILNRHAMGDGAFATGPVPAGLSYGRAVAYWGDHLVVLAETGVLTAYTTDLAEAWAVPLEVPGTDALRLVAGNDGALYIISGPWVSRIVAN